MAVAKKTNKGKRATTKAARSSMCCRVSGLTKLDYFAGLAMQALIAAEPPRPLRPEHTAELAYTMARAMLSQAKCLRLGARIKRKVIKTGSASKKRSSKGR